MTTTAISWNWKRLPTPRCASFSAPTAVPDIPAERLIEPFLNSISGAPGGTRTSETRFGNPSASVHPVPLSTVSYFRVDGSIRLVGFYVSLL